MAKGGPMQGRSDGGGYIGIYTPPPKSVPEFFYVVVLSPWRIYTHPNQIPGYASGWTKCDDANCDINSDDLNCSKCLLLPAKARAVLFSASSHIFFVFFLDNFCQHCFGFEMPSELWAKRITKLNEKIANCTNSFVARFSQVWSQLCKWHY